MLRRACGVDVHRDNFVATILSGRDCETRRFVKDAGGVEAFKAWLKKKRCRSVVMESTGVYWIPLYAALEGEFDVKLANAQKTRKVPGRKTDQSDSEWLAQLLKSGLIEACYVPCRKIRVLRELTRLRTKLVQNRTDYKNRVHKVLERCNIRLGCKLSSVFGRAGMEVLEGIMAGKSFGEIVGNSKSWVLKRRKDEIEEAVRSGLDEEEIFLLKRCLRMIERLDEEISEVDARIAMLIGDYKEDVRRISGVPGVDKVSAPAILAEIGDAKRFANGKKIASWAGLCPVVYQTSEKNLTGGIKPGSKNVRRIMYQAALAATSCRNSRLRLFYLRVAARRGRKTALVALAHKMLVIIHHLLVNGEDYVEEGFVKASKFRFRDLARISLGEMVEVLRRAGFVVWSPG